MHPPADYFRYAFEMRLDNIAFGCLMAISAFEGYASKFIRAIPAHVGCPFITVAALAGGASLETLWGGGYFFTLGLTVNSGLIAVLLIQLVVLARTSMRWLEIGPLRYLGRISYSLYLYHSVVIVLVNHYLPDLRWRWQLLYASGASILMASASYALVAKPFLRLKERFHARKVAPLALGESV